MGLTLETGRREELRKDVTFSVKNHIGYRIIITLLNYCVTFIDKYKYLVFCFISKWFIWEPRSLLEIVEVVLIRKIPKEMEVLMDTVQKCTTDLQQKIEIMEMSPQEMKGKVKYV